MRKHPPTPAAALTPKTDVSALARLPVPVEAIGRRIYLLRGQKVMLDSGLAELYRVETKALNRAVKRNSDRFPVEYMFQLTESETESLRCQNGTSKQGPGGRRYLPYAFTEHGVVMLSAVLNSQRAVQMSILIVNAFVKLREMVAAHRDLARKIERLERRQQDHSAVLEIVVKDVQELECKVKQEFRKLRSPSRRKPRIGFIPAPR